MSNYKLLKIGRNFSWINYCHFYCDVNPIT